MGGWTARFNCPLQPPVLNYPNYPTQRGRYLEKLNQMDDFTALVELFKPIMHTLMLIWKHSKYYNNSARFVTLMCEICNDLIMQVSGCGWAGWGAPQVIPGKVTPGPANPLPAPPPTPPPPPPFRLQFHHLTAILLRLWPP